jgi:hypothetical protein
MQLPVADDVVGTSDSNDQRTIKPPIGGGDESQEPKDDENDRDSIKHCKCPFRTGEMRCLLESQMINGTDQVYRIEPSDESAERMKE